MRIHVGIRRQRESASIAFEIRRPDAPNADSRNASSDGERSPRRRADAGSYETRRAGRVDVAINDHLAPILARGCGNRRYAEPRADETHGGVPPDRTLRDLRRAARLSARVDDAAVQTQAFGFGRQGPRHSGERCERHGAGAGAADREPGVSAQALTEDSGAQRGDVERSAGTHAN
ncbi:hypothetical protein [Burkholderia sp. ABCPW 111]|uniref:hypothetical protein n=1 Tax=Burkholderia sp. ABCPW 111 TaxID=1820025 RepID=UPI00126A2A98|nr:hypothetical protein [Burkholderia sp. ABCPW 111]